MSEPTHPSSSREPAGDDAEESVKFSHPGAPAPPGDESTGRHSAPDSSPDDSPDGKAAGNSDENTDEESVKYSHPGSPTPPGDGAGS